MDDGENGLPLAGNEPQAGNEPPVGNVTPAGNSTPPDKPIFEPPPKFVWVLLMLAAILFLPAGTAFQYQNLRGIPVYGSGGSMHEFVDVVEQELAEAKNQFRYQSSAERELEALQSLEPRFKALEKYSILAARDFLRLKKIGKGGIKSLDQRTYTETEAALATYCESYPSEPQCMPDPECRTYQAWAQVVELSQLTGATSEPNDSNKAQLAEIALTRPTIRAMLGCSQRSIQILNEASKSQPRSDDILSTQVMRKLAVSYPDLESTTWLKVRTFIESYRVLFPSPNPDPSKLKAKPELLEFMNGAKSAWSLPWMALLWIPLFIQYIVLAAVCGAIANVLRSCINKGDDRDKYQLALQGGAAAWFAIMLIMLGFTITGVTGAQISKVPEPTALMIISFIAGLNADQVNSILGRITSDILRGVPRTPGG